VFGNPSSDHAYGERPRQAVTRAREQVRRENDLVVASVVETLAAVALDQVGMVVANDSARSSLSAVSGGDLLALDADLNELRRWPLGPRWTPAASPPPACSAKPASP
jgi:hypothetical protein